MEEQIDLSNVAELFNFNVTPSGNFYLMEVLEFLFGDGSPLCLSLTEEVQSHYPDVFEEMSVDYDPDAETEDKQVPAITPIGLMKLMLIVPTSQIEDPVAEFVHNIRANICLTSLAYAAVTTDEPAEADEESDDLWEDEDEDEPEGGVTMSFDAEGKLCKIILDTGEEVS